MTGRPLVGSYPRSKAVLRAALKGRLRLKGFRVAEGANAVRNAHVCRVASVAQFTEDSGLSHHCDSKKIGSRAAARGYSSIQTVVRLTSAGRE